MSEIDNYCHVNIMALCNALKMNRSKVYRIKNGGDTEVSSLEKINDYLRKLGE